MLAFLGSVILSSRKMVKLHGYTIRKSSVSQSKLDRVATKGDFSVVRLKMAVQNASTFIDGQKMRPNWLPHKKSQKKGMSIWRFGVLKSFNPGLNV